MNASKIYLVNMKKIFCLILALGTLCGLSAQNLPDVRIENQNGEVVSTRSLAQGKPLIISFWSTTCKPCIMELNAINDQIEDWRQEADFDVIAVSIDDVRSLNKAKSMASGYEWDFTALYDKNQDFKRAMNVSLTPQAFVVDGNGKVVYSHSGYTPGSEQVLFDKIKELQK